MRCWCCFVVLVLFCGVDVVLLMLWFCFNVVLMLLCAFDNVVWCEDGVVLFYRVV